MPARYRLDTPMVALTVVLSPAASRISPTTSCNRSSDGRNPGIRRSA
jgi:hypothetical protein